MGARLQNRYELGEPLEALEVGVWHRGEDTRSRRTVRIALLAANAPAERLAAFERVARLAQRVRHPGVERVLSNGRDDGGRAFLVVEHFQGKRLEARLLEQPPVKLHDLLRSVTSVLNGLDIAHKAGLVHGGIEPSRLLVDDKLRAQLGGFALHGASGSAPAAELARWLAPEVLEGAEPTAASDVYGMGAILYRAFVGEPPRLGDGLSLRERRRTIPVSLAETIDKAIAAVPAQRPRSAGDLRKELTAAMVGAQGLRMLLVPRGPESGDEDSDITERLTLADLQVPTARELFAWTKPKSDPPPIPRERMETNRRGGGAAPSRSLVWKRSDPPPLPSPSNATSNERAFRPPPAQARHVATPPLSSGARGVQAKSTTPASAPRPAVAVAKVKLVSMPVARRAAPNPAPRVVEIDALADIETIEDLEPISDSVALPPAAEPVKAVPSATIVEPEPLAAPSAPAPEPEPLAPPSAAVLESQKTAAEEEDDDEPELEASIGGATEATDLADEDPDDADEAPWSEVPKLGPWPYPTGGPPGLVLPRVVEPARPSGTMPALAIALLAVGLIIAAAGSMQVASTFGEAPAPTVVAGPAAGTVRVRARRRPSAPARSDVAAPSVQMPTTPATVAPAPAAPVVEPPPPAPAAPALAPPPPVPTAPVTPVVAESSEPDREARPRARSRRRSRPAARPSAPSMAPSAMSTGRTLVRDPGF